MITKRVFLMLLTLFIGLSCFGQGVSSSTDEPKQVAVFVYCDKSVTTPVSALSAKLTSTLVNEVGDSYRVVDRTAEIMSALRSEYDYQGSGMVRDDQLVSVGEHLGAYYLCVVSVTYYSDYNQYSFECKLVNVETREIEKQSMYPDDEKTVVSSLSPQMQYKVGGALSSMFAMKRNPVNNSRQPNATIRNNNGHDWVDLGTGVKWATTNVGAQNPEDYGDYFAWGEVESKSECSWKTYKLCDGTQFRLTKYNTISRYGNVDNKTCLVIGNDVASKKWGKKWRMPTDAEWEALINRCEWIWTTINGIDGFKVVGRNGNSIFLPAAGWRSGFDIHGCDTYQGMYWSSSLSSNDPDYARGLMFHPSFYYRDNLWRCLGFSVRPVTD